MHQTTELYKNILSGNHKKEFRVVVSGVEYRADDIVSLSTNQSLYSDSGPCIGACVSGGIEVSYLPGNEAPPRMAKIELYVRIVNETDSSEWIPKGVYYTDTRIIDPETGVYTLTGFDAMLLAEKVFLSEGETGEWPRSSTVLVEQIASKMGVSIDGRTVLNSSYKVAYPNDFTCRELLSQIAVAHAGNWVITDAGELRLVRLTEIPEETWLLVTETGDVIRFGEVGIIAG